jgi:hypothetical protein
MRHGETAPNGEDSRMAERVTMTQVVGSLADTVARAAMKLPPRRRAEDMPMRELIQQCEEAAAFMGNALGWVDTLQKLVLENGLGLYSTERPESTQVR